MLFDIPTLSIAVLLVELAGLVAVGLVVGFARDKPAGTSKAVLLWSVSFLLVGLGSALIGLHGLIGKAPAPVSAFALLLIGAGLRPGAVAVLFGRRPNLWLPLVLGSVWIAVSMVPGIPVSANAGILCVFGAMMLSALMIGWLCVNANREKLTTVHLLAATMLLETAAYGVLVFQHVHLLFIGFPDARDAALAVHYLILRLVSAVTGAVLLSAMILEGIKEAFRVQAHTDPLTGLPSRPSFLEAASTLIGLQNNARAGYSLIVLEIDGFSDLESRYGQNMGDALLKLLGRLCHQSVPDSAIAGRTGGPAFGLCVPDLSQAAAGSLAARIRRQFTSEINQTTGGRLSVTVSCGVFTGQPGVDIAEGLDIAGRCLWQAKSQGHSRMVFVGSSDSRAQRRPPANRMAA